MKRVLYLLIPLAFLMAVIAPGCYTMITHPSDEGSARVDHTSDCVRCHFEFDDFPYGYYYSPYPEFWWDHPDYVYYFAYPWWWEHFYSPVVADRESKFDRRYFNDELPPPVIIIDNDPVIIVPSPSPVPSPPNPYPNPPRRPPSDPADQSGPREKGDQGDSGKERPQRPKPQPAPDTQDNSKTEDPAPKDIRQEQPKKKTPRGGGR